MKILKKTLRATPTSQAEIATAVSNYLKIWLADHILGADMAYKDFLKQAA